MSQEIPEGPDRIGPALEGSNALVAVLDRNGALISVSDGMKATFGLRGDPVAYADLRQGIDLPPWQEAVSILDEAGELYRVVQMFRSDGSTGRGFLAIHQGRDEPQTYVLYLFEAGHLSTSRSPLELEALRDPLTQLQNRRFLDLMVEDLVQASASLALLLLDLDGFKTINDTYGHATGDEVLRHVSRILMDTVPLGDPIVRLGGDEFLVVIEGPGDRAEVEALARRITDAIARPMLAGGREVVISASSGIGLMPEQGQNLEELLAIADADMYRNKRTEGDEPAPGPVSRPQLLQDMARDLRKGLFRPSYQPIVDITTGGIIGIEALCRWHHPDRGIVMPDDFIPIAMRHDLVTAIDKCMFSQVCADMAELAAAGAPPLLIFFNLSILTLRSDGIEDFLTDSIRGLGLDRGRFCAEISESMTFNELDPGRESVFRLNELGLHVVLDDFGTGYSSLALLKSLPVSWIKIDRSFVRDLCTNPKDCSIVEHILALSRSLDATVIAEGIETFNQLETLTKMGLDCGQGFLFDTPLSFDVLQDRLLR